MRHRELCISLRLVSLWLCCCIGSDGMNTSPGAGCHRCTSPKASPYVVVMTLSVILYKNLGFSNTDIAPYTSWPSTCPGHQAAVVAARRAVRAQATVGGGAAVRARGSALASVALTLPGPQAFKISLAVFWLMAFARPRTTSRLMALSAGCRRRRAGRFVGVRPRLIASPTSAGRAARLAGGTLAERTGSVVTAWSWVFGVLGGGFALLALWRLWRCRAR